MESTKKVFFAEFLKKRLGPEWWKNTPSADLRAARQAWEDSVCKTCRESCSGFEMLDPCHNCGRKEKA